MDAPIPAMLRGMRTALLVVAMLIGGASVVWLYLEKREAPARPRGLKQVIHGERAVADFFAQPPVDVTAKQLISVWQTNEVAARQQFLGRPLRIDGHVSRVSVEHADGSEFPALYFAEGGVCIFNWGRPQPELASLRRGQRVVVLGQPRGTRPGVDHLTTHCSLESRYE